MTFGKLGSGLKWCIGFTAVVSAFGCTSLSKIKVDEEPNHGLNISCSQTIPEQVDNLVHPLIENKTTLGMVVAILNQDGVSSVYNYGFTDNDKKTPISGETLFAVGSVTKGFTAELTALLVNEGYFKWDDTLKDLLPSNIELSPDAQNITLRQLASHTSGLPRQMMNVNVLSKFVAYLFDGENFYADLDNGKFLEYLSEFKVESHHEVIYSNLGYALLDYIIEQKTHRPAEELVVERILTPLQMTQTSFNPGQLSNYSERAVGHAGDQPKFIRRGHTVPDWHFSRYMIAAASAHSTANDLLKYLHKHLYGTGDAKLDAAFKEATLIRNEGVGLSSGLGWMQEQFDGQKIKYQSGFIAGYSSFIALDEKHKTAMVVLQNNFNWNNEVGGRILVRMARDLDSAKSCSTSKVANETNAAKANLPQPSHTLQSEDL